MNPKVDDAAQVDEFYKNLKKLDHLVIILTRMRNLPNPP